MQAEIARMLRRKGMCVITVPFGPESVDEFRSPRGFRWAKIVQENAKTQNVFYQRRYSIGDLTDRITRPSGLTLKKLQFIGETFLCQAAGSSPIFSIRPWAQFSRFSLHFFIQKTKEAAMRSCYSNEELIVTKLHEPSTS
jgi:hypothetical protein